MNDNQAAQATTSTQDIIPPGPNPSNTETGGGTEKSSVKPREPEPNLVVTWNEPGGTFSGWDLDEYFPYV
ncbi:hypothetical protein FRC15_002052 [Serendipita sp. 397]|nr:hypothetical protein FRC15_002052 [Serendipita sp. 397]